MTLTHCLTAYQYVNRYTAQSIQCMSMVAYSEVIWSLVRLIPRKVYVGFQQACTLRCRGKNKKKFLTVGEKSVDANSIEKYL